MVKTEKRQPARGIVVRTFAK